MTKTLLLLLRDLRRLSQFIGKPPEDIQTSNFFSNKKMEMLECSNIVFRGRVGCSWLTSEGIFPRTFC